jgi:hypothetical protein
LKKRLWESRSTPTLVVVGKLRKRPIFTDYFVGEKLAANGWGSAARLSVSKKDS